MQGINGNIIICFILVFFLSACGADTKDYIDTPFDKELIPTMATDSVTELISDSGIIRYKLITDKWLFFEKASDPRWYFPEGLYVEQFDTNFQVKVTLKADTAWNYTQRKLWKLKGNVFVRNALDETFESQELYWDERRGKVYSDSYIEINRPGKLLLKGHGFVSNQRMTDYHIVRPFDTDLYYEENPQTGIYTDTVN